MVSSSTYMSTTILLDGDIVAYKHASGSEVATDWGDDIWSLWTDVRQATQQMDADIQAIVKNLKATKIVIALSGKENFRRDIDPTYKHSRKSSRKPMGLVPLREHLFKEWDAELVEPLEADDLLGVWATDPEFCKGTRKIIVSSDKDMRTIPCELWNPNKAEEGIKKISKESADRFHLYQTLIGDSTDGYLGCPTIGPTRAKRILDEDATWDAVVNAFTTQGQSSEEALVQARLARILRVENYNPVTKKIEYWKP